MAIPVNSFVPPPMTPEERKAFDDYLVAQKSMQKVAAPDVVSLAEAAAVAQSLSKFRAYVKDLETQVSPGIVAAMRKKHGI